MSRRGRFVLWTFGIVFLGTVLLAVFVGTQGELIARLFLKPGVSFDESTPPPAPDYTKDADWVALPGRADLADVRPLGETPLSAREEIHARADVFFIHPTTFLSGASWNAPLDDEDARLMLEGGVMRYQASAFNLCCRVYAPRYRQATLWAFMGYEEDGAAALEFAYEDVKRAFQHFLDTYSDGRPFILAAHSQGSLHAMRLLQEVIALRPEVGARMVAAYIIGYAVPKDMGIDTAPCRTAEDTGCYINWNSLTSLDNRDAWQKSHRVWLNGRMQSMDGRLIACVNPLSWEIDGDAGRDANTGALPGGGFDLPMEALLPKLTGARCEEGLLLIEVPEAPGFDFFIQNDDYHVYDYNLFYDNIRRNAQTRIDAFLTP